MAGARDGQVPSGLSPAAVVQVTTLASSGGNGNGAVDAAGNAAGEGGADATSALTTGDLALVLVGVAAVLLSVVLVTVFWRLSGRGEELSESADGASSRASATWAASTASKAAISSAANSGWSSAAAATTTLESSALSSVSSTAASSASLSVSPQVSTTSSTADLSGYSGSSAASDTPTWSV